MQGSERSAARPGESPGARVLLGVTGSIAAYKACELLRLLVKEGNEVTPLLTPDAQRFVGSHTFEALARREVAQDLYPHLTEADLLVVAPLSANTLAKLAHGLADNVLTQAALAFRGPILLAPAMNVRMWEHPATQENVSRLRARGIELIGPEAGELAEGEAGWGRMSEPERILERCRQLLGAREPGGAGHVPPVPAARGDFEGKRVLVSAGGTREPLDRVRFIGNRSSGRMGVALAAEAHRRGADVTLLAANLSVPPPSGVEVIETPTVADLEREALARADADVVLMAAAVSDYRPAEPLATKRTKDGRPWTVALEPTTDVLAELGRRASPPRGRVLVGFAADEGESGLARAREKLAAKNGTLLVFNDVSRSDIGFDSDENEVVLVSAKGERTIDKRSKREVAAVILDEVAALLEGE
jgi:phosphopantothenoylcysteine decarboxylase / phosphopantothenate---cysteine ligase